MAHFAQLDKDNNVVQVVVVADSECVNAFGQEMESIGAAFCEKIFGGRWIQTSYNGRKRGLFAGIGFKYDEVKDVFYDPKAK
jgi:hypothetical protein